jgi:hypothetical protein
MAAGAVIQIELFSSAPPISAEPELLVLMRLQKWAHGGQSDVALTSIEVVPHAGRWMWAACLDSRSGAGQGAKALAKWGQFADTKHEAILRSVDEVRVFMHRANAEEQLHISQWLGGVLSRLDQLTNPEQHISN